jgi:hypothetical protein
MEQIVLERCLEPPIRLADVPAMEDRAAWCMEQYRVRHLVSLLSLDGARLVCSFEAPDAEAVRSVLRRIGATFLRVWPATVHLSLGADERHAGDRDTLVVVERCFAEPVDLAALQVAEDAAAWCLVQHRVRLVRTYHSRDRRRMICTYLAPDAEAVRRAQHAAGMPFDDAWSALVYEAAR